jgi:hypothetical protein
VDRPRNVIRQTHSTAWVSGASSQPRTRHADNDLFASYPSHVVLRHTGSVDTSLWHELNRAVYIPCFKGKISAEPVRDPVTLKLISGPVITKTDAGPVMILA